MDRIPVNSSAVSHIAYEDGALTVWWQNSNRASTFLGVPLRIWEMLQGAQSKGQFINRRIKGTYKEA